MISNKFGNYCFEKKPYLFLHYLLKFSFSEFKILMEIYINYLFIFLRVSKLILCYMHLIVFIFSTVA